MLIFELKELNVQNKSVHIFLRMAWRKVTGVTRRGHMYSTLADFMAIENETNLEIPAFETIFKGTNDPTWKVRQDVVVWMDKIAVQEFYPDSTPVLCLAVELLDTFLVKVEMINIKRMTLLGIVCLWIAGKYHMDHFEKEVASGYLILLIGDEYTKKDVIETERVLLKAFDWNISSKYTLPWFVDYLGGFKEYDKTMLDKKICKYHVSGVYRYYDPYTAARNILRAMEAKKGIIKKIYPRKPKKNPKKI